MAASKISGPLTVPGGLVGAVTGNLTGNVGDTTSAEIAARNDDSVMEQSLIAAGAVSLTVAITKLNLVGAGAVTLAAPSKPGFIKIIRMDTDNGDVTLALTNVVGGSAATTCTFNDIADRLVLVSDSAASGKWIVLKESGVTLA